MLTDLIQDYHDSLDKIIDKLLELHNNELAENILDTITDETEYKVIKRVLDHTDNNHTKTAKILGISRSTLLKKLKNSLKSS